MYNSFHWICECSHYYFHYFWIHLSWRCQSWVSVSSLDQKLILHNNGQNLCDNDTITGSHDENNDGLSDTLDSQKERHSAWQQVRWVMSSKHSHKRAFTAVSTGHFFNFTQVCAAMLFDNVCTVQKSEDISVQKYLTLQNIESKVKYCLTFS